MADGVSVIAVPAWEFPSWQEKASQLFQRFEDKFPDEQTWEELEPEILAREYQLWLVMQNQEPSAMALTFIKTDKKKTCVISHCAGEDFEQWAGQLLATIRVWSHSLGSTKLEAVTRPGWERVLRPFGMVKTHAILELKDNG